MSDQRPFQRTPSPQSASWFLDLNSARQLELDPPYQRRSVWGLDYRQFFIDSIIRNYPTQSIFVEVSVDPDRPTQYRVLDGKQRLTSLLMFADNAFATPDSLADLGLDGVYYSDLSKEVKTRILSYLFTVEVVTEASAAELNQAFDRLNRNVARLNRQELRHAQFGGAFITKMEQLSDDPLWDEIGLVTVARRRRMLDVEYVSEFYVVAARGIQDGKDYLDRIYAEWNEEIPNSRAIDQRFRKAVAFIAGLNEIIPLAGTRYSNVADFYSLWAATLEILESGLPPVEEAADRLGTFLAELDAQSTDRSRDYFLSARQGSNKATNRTFRAALLAEVLIGTA